MDSVGLLHLLLVLISSTLEIGVHNAQSQYLLTNLFSILDYTEIEKKDFWKCNLSLAFTIAMFNSKHA